MGVRGGRSKGDMEKDATAERTKAGQQDGRGRPGDLGRDDDLTHDLFRIKHRNNFFRRAYGDDPTGTKVGKES